MACWNRCVLSEARSVHGVWESGSKTVMPSSKAVSRSQPAESPARAGPEAIPTLSWGGLCEVQRLGDLSKAARMSSRVEPRAQVSEAVEFPV